MPSLIRKNKTCAFRRHAGFAPIKARGLNDPYPNSDLMISLGINYKRKEPKGCTGREDITEEMAKKLANIRNELNKTFENPTNELNKPE